MNQAASKQPFGTAILIVLVGLALTGCAGVTSNTSAQAKPETIPYVVVLGTAQDGGLPQIGCTGSHCSAARADARRRRFVASLLIADPRTGKRWLIDATPDIREQVELARNHPTTRQEKSPRPALFDGIFLTHAHTGHYTGLIHLGRSAYNANKIPVYGSARMCEFLNGNGPWDFMVRNANIELHKLEPDRAVSLGVDLSIAPVLVPHRAEYTDTFREDGEIPGGSMADIPHPFIKESIRRFGHLPEQRSKIVFTHLNHTNLATNPESGATDSIREQGMDVAQEGQRFGL